LKYIYKQTVATTADQIRSGALGWLHSQRNKQQRKKLSRCSKQRLNGTLFWTEKRNIWIFIAEGVVFTKPIILKSIYALLLHMRLEEFFGRRSWRWRSESKMGKKLLSGCSASAVKPLSNLSAWYLDDTVETCRACRERGWTDSI